VIPEIINYTNSNTKKWSLAFSGVSVSDTKRGGIRNPTAVPIIFTTDSTAIANDLLQ
jgi:hypothetical protein